MNTSRRRLLSGRIPSSASVRRPVWWRSIHWRLMASYVLLAAFVIGTIWIFLRAVLDQSIWATMTVAAVVGVVVAGLLGLIASRLFSRPLTALGGVALRIAEGDFSGRIDYPVADELGLLADSLDHLSSELSEKIRQLTEEKTRLSTILRSMGEGVFVVDAEGRVALTNPAVREILSLTLEETEGLQVDDIDLAPSLASAFERTKERREAFVDEFVIQRGNQRLDVMTSTAPIEEDGRLLGMVAVLNDISQVRRLERVRRDFVANVSHELRTPLTAVRGYAETLLDAEMDLPEMAVDFLATIHRHAVRLSRLIDDLLALAAIEGRGLDSRLGPVDAEEVVNDVIETLQTLAGEGDVAIEAHTLTHPLPRARAEVRALRHVLTNLLENALKYTLPGGRVDLRLSLEGDHIVIVVQDTGIGIASEHLPRIFERFYRVDEGRSRDVGGSGLGLALVKHLVNTLGATIDVESEVGHGSTFVLRLQRA